MTEGTLKMMVQWGADEKSLALARQLMAQQAGRDGDCEVWPENWDHWQFFQQVGALWERAGMDGRRCALDWPAVEVVARGLGRVRRGWKALVADLLLIQDAVLAVDRQQAEQQRNTKGRA